MGIADGLPGLISGFQQGYSFVDDIERKKKDDARLDDQNKRAQNQDARADAEFSQKKKGWDKEAEYEAERKALIDQYMRPPAAPATPLAAAGVAPPQPVAAASPPVDQPMMEPAQTMPPRSAPPVSGAAGTPAAQAIQQGTGVPPPAKPDPMGNLNNTLDFAIKSAIVDLKHGKIDGAGLLTVQKTVENMKSEKMDQAISLLNQGRYDEAQREFNSTGDHTTFKLVDAKDGVFKIGNSEIPTKIVTVRDEAGNTRIINTAQTLFQRQAMDKIIAQAQKGATDAESARHNKAAERVAQERLAMEKGSANKQTLQGKYEEIKSLVGDMSPEEDKRLRRRVAGVLEKGEDLSKFVQEQSLEWQKAHPDSTPAELATFKAKLEQALPTARTNEAVESQVKRELSDAKGTESYAEKYQQAVQLGLPAERLKTLGFAPPPKPKAAKQAAQMGTVSGTSAAGNMADEMDRQDTLISVGKMKEYTPEIKAYIAAEAEKKKAKAAEKDAKSKAELEAYKKTPQYRGIRE